MRAFDIGPYQLPFISDVTSTNQINCIYKVGKITIFRHTFNSCRFTAADPPRYVGEPLMNTLASTIEYRYVFIPGLTAAAMATANKLTTQLSYNEMCNLYNIAP